MVGNTDILSFDVEITGDLPQTALKLDSTL
jgi:hypothetical protein